MTLVLAAVDDSAAARPVLQMALALAPVVGGEVEAVHVAEAPGLTAEACAQSLAVPLQTVPGDPLTEVLRRVEQEDVVAVVVGARGRPTGRRPAGHVALALAGATVKPVVVVPPQASPGDRVRRVLVAMEGTRRSGRQLQRAIRLGADAGADLDIILVHVEDEDAIPSFGDQVQYEAQAYADEFLARFCVGAPSAQLRLRVGSPAEEILATVGELEPDLLAIGWPQVDQPARGQVARDLLDRSSVPVLLVALAHAQAEEPAGSG